MMVMNAGQELEAKQTHLSSSPHREDTSPLLKTRNSLTRLTNKLENIFNYQNTLCRSLDVGALTRKHAKIKKYSIVQTKHFHEIQKKTDELDEI